MSSTAVIAIVIAAVVVLAAIAFVTAARRGDVRRGAGSLSRETRRRDRSTVPAAVEEPAVTGREIERAAVAERSTALEPARSAAPAPWTPPDAETIGFTRRQFFNRSTVTLMSVGLSGFGVACIAFLWPKLGGGFGSKINVGKTDDLASQIEGAKNALYLAEARTWLVQYPKEALPKATKVYSGAILTGMEAGFVALYQKCVHLGLPGAVLRDVAVVRVPVPRLAVQPSRREEGRSGATWPRPLRHLGDRWEPRHRHRQHLARSHHRHQHHRPGGRGSPLHHLGGGSLSAARPSVHAEHRHPHPGGAHRRVAGVPHLERAQSGPARGRLRDRAGTEPQGVLRRRAARRPALGAVPAHRPRPARHQRRRAAAVLAARAGPPGRRRRGRREHIRHLGLARLRHHGRRRLQLRRLPRRHEGPGRRGRLHRPGSPHRRGEGGQLDGAGAQHGAVPVHARTRSRTSSPTAARSHRCRHGASPVAAR